MRATLIISDPVYERARRTAKEQGTTVSAWVTEAMEEALRRRRARRRPAIAIKPAAMGAPRVDIDNREELYRAMEER